MNCEVFNNVNLWKNSINRLGQFTNFLFLVLFSSIFIGCSIPEVAFGNESAPLPKAEVLDESSYDRDWQRLQKYSSPTEGSLKPLDHLGHELHLKWVNGPPQYYVQLMLEVSQMFQSGYFGINNQMSKSLLAGKYACLGLLKADEIPLAMEVSLTRSLTWDHGRTIEFFQAKPRLSLDTKELPKSRKDFVSIWLHTLSRLEIEMAKKVDGGEYKRYVDPPKGYEGHIQPLPPESISDPEVRAQYEKAILKNRELGERIITHNYIASISEEFSVKTHKTLADAYSDTPENLTELQHLLKQFKISEESTAKILGAVKKNFQETKNDTNRARH